MPRNQSTAQFKLWLVSVLLILTSCTNKSYVSEGEIFTNLQNVNINYYIDHNIYSLDFVVISKEPIIHIEFETSILHDVFVNELEFTENMIDMQDAMMLFDFDWNKEYDVSIKNPLTSSLEFENLLSKAQEKLVDLQTNEKINNLHYYQIITNFKIDGLTESQNIETLKIYTDNNHKVFDFGKISFLPLQEFSSDVVLLERLIGATIGRSIVPTDQYIFTDSFNEEDRQFFVTEDLLITGFSLVDEYISLDSMKIYIYNGDTLQTRYYDKEDLFNLELEVSQNSYITFEPVMSLEYGKRVLYKYQSYDYIINYENQLGDKYKQLIDNGFIRNVSSFFSMLVNEEIQSNFINFYFDYLGRR